MIAALWTGPSTASACNVVMWFNLSWVGSGRRGEATKAVTAVARAILGDIVESLSYGALCWEQG